MEIEALLAESRKFTGSFKSAKSFNKEIEVYDPILKLPWKRKFIQALSPVGKIWSDIIVDVYYEELDEPLTENPDITIIIHGHSRVGFCSAGTQCHVLGYTPVGNEPEPWLKHWSRFGYKEG